MKWKSSEILTGLLSFFVLWELLAVVVHSSVLPSPVSVVPLFFVALFKGELGLHFAASAGRLLAAIAIGVITALPAGLLLGQQKKINRFVSPLINIVYPIPKIVLLPIVYVLMGISNFSKILLLSLILFFQILVVVRDTAASLPEELIQSVKSLGAGRLALLRFVYLPASLPAVFTAIRISVSTAIAVLFITEQSMTDYGLGYYIIVKSYDVLKYKQMYAGILAISLLGLILFLLIDFLDKRINRHLYR